MTIKKSFTEFLQQVKDSIGIDISINNPLCRTLYEFHLMVNKKIEDNSKHTQKDFEQLVNIRDFKSYDFINIALSVCNVQQAYIKVNQKNQEYEIEYICRDEKEGAKETAKNQLIKAFKSKALIGLEFKFNPLKSALFNIKITAPNINEQEAEALTKEIIEHCQNDDPNKINKNYINKLIFNKDTSQEMEIVFEGFTEKTSKSYPKLNKVLINEWFIFI